MSDEYIASKTLMGDNEDTACSSPFFQHSLVTASRGSY